MSNQVSITDLLTAIGSDNIKYQYLVNCMENIKAGKGRTIITFGTDAITTTEVALNTGPRALIIWVDGELMSQRLRELMAGELQVNIPVVPDGCLALMTLDEAIAHANEKSIGRSQCAAQHAQLAKWLTDYRTMLAAAQKQQGGAA